MRISTLRPGLLVSLKTSVQGNVNYRRFDIEAEHVTEDGSVVSKWETERSVTDAIEHDRAIKVRSKCRSLLTSVCSRSDFGLLCPQAKRDKLDAAVDEAQALAREFNASASLTRIGVFVIVGEIAQDDVQAVRAINNEISGLMSAMERGLRNLDVKVVRDAANRAKEVGAMLDPNAAARIQVAINVARSAARKIAKAGEAGSIEIDAEAVRLVTEARTQFLDLDEVGEIQAPVESGLAIDLNEAQADEPVAPVAPVASSTPDIEWDEDDVPFDRDARRAASAAANIARAQAAAKLDL